MKYRVAVVGCGGRSGAHIEAYKHIPDAEVTAVCDLVEERRTKVAAKYGVTAYADASEMIRAEKPDLVHLVTHPTVRVPLMTLMSELGVPACTTEKPVAIGVRDWRALCKLEASTTTRFGVSHQFRWQKHLCLCRRALESGRLGRVTLLDLSSRSTISDQGTHILNYGMSLNGDSPVVRVFGTVSGPGGFKGTHPAPEQALGCLTFANGVRALWTMGPTAPVVRDPKEGWQHVRVAAVAERGRTNYEEFGKWEVVGPHGAEEGHFGDMNTWRANNIEAQAGFHRAMLDWLEDDAKVPGTSLKQSLHEWKAVLALYAGTLHRRPIEMAEFEPEDDLIEELVARL